MLLNSMRFHQNQGDVFIEIDPILTEVSQQLLGGVDFDTHRIIHAVVFTEAVELIIQKPNFDTATLTDTITGLVKHLRNPNIVLIIKNLAEYRTLPVTIFTKNPELPTITVHLRNLDYYLMEAYEETSKLRDERVEDFLQCFIATNALKNQITTGSELHAGELIYKILKRVTDDNYFLTDADLEILVGWLVESYNTETNIFSPNTCLSSRSFVVDLITRSILVGGL